MYIVLCYDIVRDSPRARLHRRLRALLTPVQKSVFEGELSPSMYPGLLEMIAEIIDLEADTVRIYHLTSSGQRLTEHIGTSIHVEPRDEDIIL